MINLFSTYLLTFNLQGIEALETWVDPSSQPTPENTDTGSDTVTPTKVSTEDTAADNTATATPAPPKPVICKKGKCQPYDPTKDRVSTQVFGIVVQDNLIYFQHLFHPGCPYQGQDVY